MQEGGKEALNLKKSESQETVSIPNKGRKSGQHCPAED